MATKDYYQILELDAGADKSSIKKAYRKLAMRHHPDKQRESESTSVHFQEIQEAYETLSDPYKREQYLQSRWLEQALGKNAEGFLSASEIIKLTIKTEQYLSGVDKFKLDSYTLLNYLLVIFNITRINTILSEKNQAVENTFIEHLMLISKHLSSDGELQLKERLNKILENNNKLNQAWLFQIAKKRKSELLDRLTIPIVLVLVLIICIVIYFSSK